MTNLRNHRSPINSARRLPDGGGGPVPESYEFRSLSRWPGNANNVGPNRRVVYYDAASGEYAGRLRLLGPQGGSADLIEVRSAYEDCVRLGLARAVVGLRDREPIEPGPACRVIFLDSDDDRGGEVAA